MGFVAVTKDGCFIIRESAFASYGKTCIGDFPENVFRKIEESLIPNCDESNMKWENDDANNGNLIETTQAEKDAKMLLDKIQAKIKKAKEITRNSIRDPLNDFLNIGIDINTNEGVIDAILLMCGHVFLKTLTNSQLFLVSEDFTNSLKSKMEQKYSQAQSLYSMLDASQTLEDIDNIVL